MTPLNPGASRLKKNSEKKVTAERRPAAPPKHPPKVNVQDAGNIPLKHLAEQAQQQNLQADQGKMTLGNIPTEALMSYLPQQGKMNLVCPCCGLPMHVDAKKLAAVEKANKASGAAMVNGAPLLDVVNKGVPADFESKVKSLAGQLPDAFQTFLTKHGVKIEAVRDLGSLGVIPGFGSAVGIYLFKENVIQIPQFITIFDVAHPNGVQVPNPNVNLALFTHEASHAVDRWLGDEEKIIPNGGYPPMYNFEPTLAKAYEKDLANLTKNVPDASDRAILDYITNTKSGVNRARVEAMAETMSALVNGNSTRPKDLVLKAFPTFSKLVAAALENLGFSSDSGGGSTKVRRKIRTRDVPKLISKFEIAQPVKNLDDKFFNGNANPGSGSKFQTGKANPADSKFLNGDSIQNINRFLGG